MDKLTHWVEAFPRARTTAQKVSKVLLEEIIPRYGIVDYIDSDQGTQFTSKIIKQKAELFPALPPHNWRPARKALASFPSTASAHENDHTTALSTRKRRKRAQASTKPPGGQSQDANVPLLKSTVPAQKDFPDLALLTAYFSLHHTQRET